MTATQRRAIKNPLRYFVNEVIRRYSYAESFHVSEIQEAALRLCSKHQFSCTSTGVLRCIYELHRVDCVLKSHGHGIYQRRSGMTRIVRGYRQRNRWGGSHRTRRHVVVRPSRNRCANDWLTARAREAYRQFGSHRKAAAALGINRQTFLYHLNRRALA